jgi:hypoxanthine phosphoribosyltransferase
MKNIHIESELAPAVMVGDALYEVEPLLSGPEVQAGVEAMGKNLAERYSERGSVHVLAVLNGALHFASDLRRSMQRTNPELTITSDQIRVSSYTGTRSSGMLRLHGDMPNDLQDRHILVVEDVLDTGLTLDWLVRHMTSQKPASVEIAVALHKDNQDRRPGFLGQAAIHSVFNIPNDFVVGYGLDISGRYRDLDGIYKFIPTVPEQS